MWIIVILVCTWLMLLKLLVLALRACKHKYSTDHTVKFWQEIERKKKKYINIFIHKKVKSGKVHRVYVRHNAQIKQIKT